MFHENIRQCNVIMEQRIVKREGEKKKEVEFLKYFSKLVGAFSVIYLNLPLSGWERCLKCKGENQQLNI